MTYAGVYITDVQYSFNYESFLSIRVNIFKHHVTTEIFVKMEAENKNV